MSPALTGESCMTWRLADDPAELGHARDVVRKALAGWALSEHAELAELVVGLERARPPRRPDLPNSECRLNSYSCIA